MIDEETIVTKKGEMWGKEIRTEGEGGMCMRVDNDWRLAKMLM
jgi:hypothetical protein